MSAADLPFAQVRARVAHDREPETADRRLLRGARARLRIAQHAADIASTDGLDGLSIGRLASDLGMAKSGVQTLFGTKENLQVAAVDAARDLFIAAVVDPARSAPRGLARLRALFENWLVYVRTPMFPGGCFRATNLALFDSRPGPVRRDALARDQRDWIATVAAELRKAVAAGELAAGLDVELAAFQVDAVFVATSTALRLGEPDAGTRARRAVAAIIGRESL